MAAAFPQLGMLNFDKIAILSSNHTHRPHFSSGFRPVKANYGGVIEKETEFKPSFEDYLKTMESVQSRREKRKTTPKFDEESQSMSDLQEKMPNSKQDEVRQIWIRKKPDSPQAQVVKVKSSPENFDKFGAKSFRDSETSSTKERVVIDRRVKEDKYDRIEIERAAFKSLEENSDVCDQPRVSRVDMEERIQKLAKFLNGAPIDTPEWSFSKMMRSAKIRFADYSMIRLIQILGKYENWRRVLQVIEWIQSRERFKSDKIRHIYTAALDVLGKSRRPVEALNMFNAMKQSMASYPDLVAYHSVAVTLGQAGYMKELFDVMDGMRAPPKKKLPTGVLQKWDPRLEPDVVVYNAVLNACVRRKNLDGAFWVLQQFKQQGLRPTSTTYGLIMEVMLVCERYDLVHEFFQKMQKSFIPNSLTYKVLVNAFWKEGKIDEAVRVVGGMERRGIIGSGGLYYDLARSLCSVGRCEEAIMQIEKICKVANKPLVVTYTGLIQACLDSGNIENATYVFNHMSKFCSPNLVTCNIMLKGYLDHHKFEEAKRLFEKLSENRNQVAGKDDYKQVVLPDIHTFNLMLDTCLANQRWDDLEAVYTRMLQHGYHFNAKRHSRMILEACRAGKVKMLEATWNELIRGDKVPPAALVREMFRVKVEVDDYTAALSYVTCIPSNESHKYPAESWMVLFKDNPDVFRRERLLRLTDEVNALTLSQLPSTILKNLLKSCNQMLRTQ